MLGQHVEIGPDCSLNLSDASISHFSKIHFNIIFPSTHGSSKWSHFTKTLYECFLSSIRATCSVHLSILYLITRIIFGEKPARSNEFRNRIQGTQNFYTFRHQGVMFTLQIYKGTKTSTLNLVLQCWIWILTIFKNWFLIFFTLHCNIKVDVLVLVQFCICNSQKMVVWYRNV
jgi:hypothetical protein